MANCDISEPPVVQYWKTYLPADSWLELLSRQGWALTRSCEYLHPVPDLTFSVDLGSGVGNCVVQAALEAGCER